MRGYIGNAPSASPLTEDQVPDRLITAAKLAAVPFVRGAARNLAARTNAAAPTTTIDMTADELVVKDTGGNAYLLSSVSVSPIITGSGANGLDTGAEAGNTWYYGWVIYNPTTDTVAGLISASATVPTMPSGYTAKALVTAMRNNGSSNFLAYRQFGNKVHYQSANDNVTLTNGSATSATEISVSSFVPPIAQEFTLGATGNVFSSATTNVAEHIAFVSGSTYFYNQGRIEASQNTAVGAVVDIPNTGQTYFYHVVVSSGTPSIVREHRLLGFKLPIGGE